MIAQGEGYRLKFKEKEEGPRQVIPLKVNRWSENFLKKINFFSYLNL